VYIGGILDAAKAGDRLYAFADEIQTTKDLIPRSSNAPQDDLTVGDVSTIATSKSVAGRAEQNSEEKHVPARCGATESCGLR
jgi:hypothetical protein